MRVADLKLKRRAALGEWAAAATNEAIGSADTASLARSYGVAPDVATEIILKQRKIRRL